MALTLTPSFIDGGTVKNHAGGATRSVGSSLNETSKLRALHVHSGNLFGGVETMLLTHVREQKLCPELEANFALCFQDRFSKELSANGATVHSLGEVRIRHPLTVKRARRKLKELLTREKFDVAVTHSFWTQTLFGSTLRAAGLPIAFYMHAPAEGKHWLERWGRRTKPDKVLCNSKFTCATVGRLFADGTAEVVYCPVASPSRAYSDFEKSEMRAELQTPQDAVVIVQVGRLENWKGHKTHLQALSLLKDLPNWICWQVGGAQRQNEGSYLDELKKTAARLDIDDRVRFLGNRSDVPRILAAADIYCQPNSKPEPFGISFIEALNAGLPVVTTDIGGAREIVDASCGILVRENDVDSLAHSLRKLISDPQHRTRLGRAGPARAREISDPATRLNQFYRALDSLITERD